MPEPRTLIGAWKEMRETWRRQKMRPRLTNTIRPCPRQRSTPAKTLPDQRLEGSIGELAPAGLQERA